MGCQPKDTCHDTSRQPADQWPVVDNLFVIAGWNFGYSPEWKPGKKIRAASSLIGQKYLVMEAWAKLSISFSIRTADSRMG